jgi:L-lactate utilization protein LutC
MEYQTLATPESVTRTITALAANNFNAIAVDTKEEALAKIKEMIPKGASVMNGASRTLEEIGYIDYLRGGDHGWNNLHEKVFAEADPVKQTILRKQSVISDYYLGSVHAVSETGELVIASNTGSQLPSIAYTSSNIIFVVSTKKITPSLTDALRRIEEYVVSLEDARMMEKSNVHTLYAKTLILRKENSKSGRTVSVIFVKEDLGF